MSELYDRLRELMFRAHQANELIGVNYEPDSFEVGYVRELVDDSFRLERLDRYGQNWGSFVGQMDKVLRIQTGTQYMQAVQMLQERVKLAPEHRGGPPNLEFSSILEFVKTRKLVTGVHQEEGTVLYGKVRAFSDEHVELEEISHLGYEDGIRVFPIDDILRLSYGGPDEESRQFLNRIRLGL